MNSDLTVDDIAAVTRACIVVVGKESVGKSQLISSLAGVVAGEMNFRGSTVAVQRYVTPLAVYIDTPGILRQSDTETTRRALAELNQHESVLLVVQATQLDDDLRDMLPLVQGKHGAVAVTYWDKVQPGEASQEALERLSAECGVPFVAVDATSLRPDDRERIAQALRLEDRFLKDRLIARAGWRIEPKPGWLEHPIIGPLLAVALLILPAIATIWGANSLAGMLHPLVEGVIQPLIALVDSQGPAWLQLVLTAKHGDFGYGLLNMGPFLLVWALPTVVLFAMILGAYKTSGLVERINVALHPIVRPFGLSGRDIVRVMMGFGCNVPAVISTRACSGCSRGTAISAIAFGAACSYQLPATLAVLAAAAQSTGRSGLFLTTVFMGYLLVTTLIYLRLTSPRAARSSLNLLMTPSRPFMQWPNWRALWREARGTITQFFRQALPIFVVICVVASLLAWTGVLELCSHRIAPLMSLFDLPEQAALPIIVAAIRKDGIFLLAKDNGLTFPMTAGQVLTAVYLAGVLLPCLVTALTIGRETSWRNTGMLLLRQAGFACLFAWTLAWGGRWL